MHICLDQNVQKIIYLKVILLGDKTVLNALFRVSKKEERRNIRFWSRTKPNLKKGVKDLLVETPLIFKKEFAFS